MSEISDLTSPRLTTLERQLLLKALPEGSPTRTESLPCLNVSSPKCPELPPDPGSLASTARPYTDCALGSFTSGTLLSSCLLCGLSSALPCVCVRSQVNHMGECLGVGARNPLRDCNLTRFSDWIQLTLGKDAARACALAARLGTPVPSGPPTGH